MARRSRRRGFDAEDVLAGRVTVDVHQLATLIRTVNPTGRGLGPREEERAYATKAALQSLLVRRFFDHLRIKESAPGVVALSLRATGEHAAHCPIDELDDEARSRVRFALDTGPAEKEPSAPRSTPGKREGYAERARRALESYDYEEAQAILCEACARAPDDPEAIIALLELWVDQLGDFASALALFDSLDTRMRTHPRIAGAAAVAAALGGDAGRARELLEMVRGDRATEAWGHLARRAIADASTELALEARAALMAAAPADPAIRAIDEHLEAREKDARERAEAELLEARDRGVAPAELTLMARAIERRFSRSAVAARVLREIEEEERRAAIAALLTSADERAPHDDAAAVAMWREALSLGADPAPFAARLQSAEARLREARIARAVEDILAAFGSERAAALERALDDELEVRERLLARLDPEDAELLARAARLDAKPKLAARAALAFARACAALERGKPSEAARLLDKHAKHLDGLPETATLRERVRDEEARELRAAAEQALRAAGDALECGELEEAKRALGRLRSSDLSREDAAVHEALAARLAESERIRIFDATLELREQEGDWLEVARACDAELRRASPERAGALFDRLARARAEVHRAHRFTALPIRTPDECPLPPLGRGGHVTYPHIRRVDRDTLVAASGGAGWVIVRWIDPARDAVRRVVCLRPPETSRATVDAARAHEGRVSIATSDGVVYSMDLAGDALVDAVRLAPAVQSSASVMLLSGSEHAWKLRKKSDRVAFVFDTRTGEQRRSVSFPEYVEAVPGAPLVLRPHGHGERDVLDVLDSRGGVVARNIALPGDYYSVCDGDGAVLFLCRRKRGERGPSFILAAWHPDCGGVAEDVLIFDVRGRAPVATITTSDTICFAIGLSDRTAVEAYSRASGERRWRADLAYAIAACSGGEDDAAYLLVPRPGGQRFERLSAQPPTAPAGSFVSFERAPSAWRTPPLTEAAVEVQFDWERNEMVVMPAIEAASIAFGEANRVSPETTSGRIAGIFAKAAESTGWLVLDQLEERSPLPPELRLWRVREAMDGVRWSEALALLDEVEPLLTHPELHSWCRFARGIAAYATGDVDRAVALWASAEGDDHSVEECRRLKNRVRQLHFGEPADPRDGDVALLAAIRRSDALASEGDLDGAIAALDHHLVWRAHEPQSFARLAALHLRRQPRSAGQWLRRLEVLIELVREEQLPRMIVLAVPGAHWSEERIRQVYEDARRWLDEATPPSA